MGWGLGTGDLVQALPLAYVPWVSHSDLCIEMWGWTEWFLMLEVLWLSMCVMDLVVFVPARGYEYVLEPSPVPLPLDKPQVTQVLQVSCGRAHSLVLTDGEGGELTCSLLMEEWGNSFLALGPEVAHEIEPHQISEAVGISWANQ